MVRWVGREIGGIGKGEEGEEWKKDGKTDGGTARWAESVPKRRIGGKEITHSLSPLARE